MTKRRTLAEQAARERKSALDRHGARATIGSGSSSVTIGRAGGPDPETVIDAAEIASGTPALEADAISGYVTENPSHRPFVPPDEAFDPEDGFLPAPELTRIGQALIERYPEFGFLLNADARIAYVWKRKGGKTKRKDFYGACQRPGGLLKHFAGCDYVIWIAADHVRESGFTNLQLEALVFHELSHTGYSIDEDQNSPTYGEMKLTIRGHDEELFLDELRRYGCWRQSLRRLSHVVIQLPLESVAG